MIAGCCVHRWSGAFELSTMSMADSRENRENEHRESYFSPIGSEGRYAVIPPSSRVMSTQLVDVAQQPLQDTLDRVSDSCFEMPRHLLEPLGWYMMWRHSVVTGGHPCHSVSTHVTRVGSRLPTGCLSLKVSSSTTDAGWAGCSDPSPAGIHTMSHEAR